MIKSIIRQAVRAVGFDVRRYHPANSDSAQLMAMLATHRVNLIFDVGANAGQYGKSLRESGYCGRIVSFEPLLSAHRVLVKASRLDPLWTAAPRAAIGNDDSEVEINVAANSVSSSVLQMLEAHENAAPDSRYVGKEKVPLRRLDTIAMGYLGPDSVTFVKIDTQGYEDRVVQGATALLDQTVGIQIELSLVPLYEGQLLFSEMIAKLAEKQFELWALRPAFTDLRSGRTLQMDATFFRG